MADVFDPAAEKVYEELETLFKKVQLKLEAGWILYDSVANKVETAQSIVFNTPEAERCVALRISKNFYGTLIIHGDFNGESSLLESYNRSKDWCRRYTLIDPTHSKNIFNLK